MSTVDSAASLFGGDDVAGDPFSSITGSDEVAPATAQVSTDELFGNSGDNGQDARDITNDLFGSSGTAQTYGFDAWNDASEPSAPSQSFGTSAYGAYDQSGQLHSQAQMAPPPPHGYSQQRQQSHYESSQSHDPYAPRSYATHTPASTYPSNPSYISNMASAPQPSYGAYNPGSPYSTAQIAPKNAYAPAVHASTAAPAYDPYQPSSYTPTSQTAPSSAHGQSMYSYSTPSPHAVSAIPAIPTPPKPSSAAADAYRPKTSNAYDPPIPPSRTKRVASGHYGRMTSPPSQTPQQLPPLPPPPPRGYATPPPPRSYNTPPPPARNHYAPPPPAHSHSLPPPPASGLSSQVPPHTSYYGSPAVPNPHMQVDSLAHGHPQSRAAPLQQGTYVSDQARNFDEMAQEPSHYGQAAHNKEEIVSHGVSTGNSDRYPVEDFAMDAVSPQVHHEAQTDLTAWDPASQAHTHDVHTTVERRNATVSASDAGSQPDILHENDSAHTLSTSADDALDNGTHADTAVTVHRDVTNDPYSPARGTSTVLTNTPYGVSPYAPYAPSAPAAEQTKPSITPTTAPPPRAQQRDSLDMSKSTGPRISSPAPPSGALYDPYKPPLAQPRDVFAHEPRTTSPGTMSARTSLDGPRPNPYAPPHKTPGSGAILQPYAPNPAVQQAVTEDPYAPSRHLRRETGESSNYGDYAPQRNRPIDDPSTSTHAPPRESTLVAPTYTPYAPSPTLLGSNDPLGRVAGRAPVFSFGFGGKLVTCFHGSGTLNTGFDVAMSSRQCTDVRISVLHKIIPESALDLSESVFPGPLFHDPGTPTAANLVRTGATQTKTKKARVVKYLEERAEQLSRGLAYLHGGSDERRGAEGRVVLVSLLKLLVEHDGRLSGSAQVEAAVRSVLAPHLANVPLDDGTSIPATTYGGFVAPVVDINEIPLATYSVKASALDKITEFLIQGDRRKAVHYALDQKMWAHALVISSSIDKEAWKDVVNEFVRAELGRGDVTNTVVGSPPAKPAQLASGRESLRVAYNFFAGQGAAAVQEMVPPHLLLKSNSLAPTAPTHITPISPNFPQADLTSRVPPEALSKWTETAAMLFTNPMTADSSAALVALGDYLLSNQWTEAAHACYLLSGQLSLIGGMRSPSVRIVLLGTPSPHVNAGFYRDSDSLILSEVLEFALSLASVSKGQEPFGGLPHLQAYKLVRAWSLSEVGHISAAKRYCEAIAASAGRGSPYVHPTFFEQLNGLADRLVAAPQLGKPGSWMGGKVAKPSLDGIGSWLEGRLTKFIAGEGEDAASTNGGPGSKQPAFVGPFSHYSAISSAAPSTTSSPQPSMINPYTLPTASQGPQRSGSAMAVRPNAQAPVDRASSAMDVRHRASPIARVGSASGSFASYGQASPALSSYTSPYSPHPPPTGTQSDTDAPSPLTAKPSEENEGPSMGSWWGASESTNQTPTAPTFHQLGEDDHSEGFISLMDSHPVPSPSALSQSHRYQNATTHDNDDEEDLGLGNASRKPKLVVESAPAATQAASPPTNNASSTQPSAESDIKPTPAAPSGSWFGRLWGKRTETAPGPVKANLGEESSFYYDKELKRWVNKKAGDDTPKPAAPPPPPSRVQTASPQAALRSPAQNASLAPPPRPASAVDLNSPPRKLPPRLRASPASNGIESAPTTAALGDSLIPPPGRPRSQASKRNVRSRYVDVFQSQPDSPAP